MQFASSLARILLTSSSLLNIFEILFSLHLFMNKFTWMFKNLSSFSNNIDSKKIILSNNTHHLAASAQFVIIILYYDKYILFFSLSFIKKEKSFVIFFFGKFSIYSIIWVWYLLTVLTCLKKYHSHFILYIF